jgi:DnaJ-class molecular chaperone
MARDYYDVLGVSRTADQKQVRQAYRKLARKLHPDVNPGDKNAEARFNEVNAAYEVLSDPEKRKKYDLYGGRSFTFDSSGAPSGRGGQGDSFEFSDIPGLDGLFDLFRGGGRRARPQPRATEAPVEITLEEAYNGATRVFELTSQERCATCGGSGEIAGAACHVCQGQGEVTVPLSVAVLGGEARVKTLKGEVALTVPRLTQNGKTFRLAGLGMPKPNGSGKKGSLFAKVKVVLPEKLSTKEEKLFEDLKALGA